MLAPVISVMLRTCEAGRDWSGSKPRCTEINCGRPDNAAFPNGWVEGSRTNLNSIITFRSRTDSWKVSEIEVTKICMYNTYTSLGKSSNKRIKRMSVSPIFHLFWCLSHNWRKWIIPRCHPGMKFEGEKQQATCMSDGKVSSIVSCYSLLYSEQLELTEPISFSLERSGNPSSWYFTIFLRAGKLHYSSISIITCIQYILQL